MKKILSIIIVLMLSIVLVPTINSDETFLPFADVYVDDNAAPEWYDATHVHRIQEAVNNATTGQSIYVYGGIYPEILGGSSYITIASKTLTIIGEQADIPKIRPLMSNSSAQNIFYFTGSGFTLTLQYLNISNRWGGATTPVHMGINIPAQNNLIVDHCILHDVNQVIKTYGNIIFTNNTAYNFKYRVVEGSWSGATYALQMIIKYNIIYDSVTGGTGETLKAKYGHWYGDISYNYIAGNRIGIWIDPEPGAVCKFGGTWTITHNTITSRYNPTNPGNLSQGISFTSVNGNFDKINCNDNIIDGANYYSIYHGGYTSGEPFATKTIFKNNIFHNSYWMYWNTSQKKYQWNGTGYSVWGNYSLTDTPPIAGWEYSATSGYLFEFENCSVADPMFNLTGEPGPQYWGLQYGSPAVGTASDGGNIGYWQGTPTPTNNPPEIPELVFPYNNTDYATVYQEYFNCTVFDSDYDSLTVEYYWENDTLFGVVTNATNGDISLYRATGGIWWLHHDTDYRWYVIVDDGTERTQSDETWEFHTSMAWDCNEDRVVNYLDISLVTSNYGISGYLPGEIPADVVENGNVNYLDVSSVVAHYGESY